MTTDPMAALWDDHADWWKANFCDGADPEYADQIVPTVLEWCAPAPGRRILDAGCGEGHISRAFAAAGADVVGVDLSTGQLRWATGGDGQAAGGDADRAGPAPVYVQGRIDALALADASVDCVCVVLVLEHVADLDAALGEFGRVLAPGGRLVVVLNHPLFQTPDSGWVDDHILEECYWRVGPYLHEQTTDEEVDAGVVLAFHHRPLFRYVNGIVDAGLSVVRLLEPPPPASFLDVAPSYARSTDIPRIAVLVAERRGA